MPKQLTQAELDNHLCQACAEGNRDYAALAIDTGADINAKDTADWTPLHFAVKAGADTVVALLLAKGANVNARDDAGRSPIEVADNYGFTRVVELLENAAKQHHSHAGRVTEERKDKGPPQVGG